MLKHLAITITLLLWCLSQAVAILHHQFRGQDFTRHVNNILLASHDPITLLTTPVTDGHVTPTIYHIIIGTIYPFLPDLHALTWIAFFNLIINLIGLILCYRLCLRLGFNIIPSFSITTAFAFLPTFISSSIVIASDALLFPLTMALIWYAINNRHWLWITFWLLVIFLLRFNYGFFAIAFIIIGLISHRNIWIKAGCISLILMTFMFIGFIKYQLPTVAPRNLCGQMRLDSIFGIQPHDKELWQAPYFHQEQIIDNVSLKPVQADNRYSYWALLHAALFTDFLNIHQPIRFCAIEPNMVDEYYTRLRPTASQILMEISIRTGLVISLTFIGGLLLTLLYWKKLHDWQQLIFTMGLSVWLAMIAALPITNWAYVQGVWLPRHILVALYCIFLSVFYQLIKNRTQNNSILFLGCGYLIGQSIIHALFMFITPRLF